LTKEFGEKIDWNFQQSGALWNYNLQYFDYLFQENISDEEKLYYLEDITDWLERNKLRLQSYPVALRVINSIRYFSVKPVSQKTVNGLYAQLEYLYHNLEYQISGNHLLENAFTLFMGGYVFNNEKWKNAGKNLLYGELSEQILSDGAHFELSPMYHKIILFRVMELIDWYGKTENPEPVFLRFVKDKAIKMLNWLYTVSLYENEIPYFNDSANNITYTNQQLYDFARQLDLPYPTTVNLTESGYRKFTTDKYQCITDVGQIGASYQPGHAHADALSFVLYYDKMPFLVETGTSTYQIGSVRNHERSTKAHNTVAVNDENQSEVWAGFRVGNRANVMIELDRNNRIKASHDGYKRKYGIIHQRDFLFENNKITITDILLNNKQNQTGQAYFHFHPDRKVTVDHYCINIDNIINITFDKCQTVVLADYNFAEEFNTYQTGKKAIVSFIHQLNTTIEIK
jgi:uncharacterized heparinase superfamily protein